MNIGDVLGDSYQIIEQIGEGGGGIVYKARHLRLDTLVVVKQIREEVKDRVYRRQEADILKQLKHPNLPRVYDFIETDEGIYTVMDFIEGTSLDNILNNGSHYTQRDIVKWGRQLSDALAYLHSQTPAIIHSDIKPANIIINSNGDATLIDFNVSVLFDDSLKFSVGISIGYAPPEQYRDIETYKKVTHVNTIPGSATERVFSSLMGTTDINQEAQKAVYHVADEDATEIWDDDKTVILKRTMTIDARSDVYSLGAVLYHLVTGNGPEIDFNAIVPLSKLNLNISEGLVVIIDKMMALKPDDRYQSGIKVHEAFVNIYKLDRRYIAIKRKEKVLLVAALLSLVFGCGLVVFGIKRIQIEYDAHYDNEVLTADNSANNYNYQVAIETVKALEEEKPERLKAFEREAYYLYLSGDYECAQNRIQEIFASQIVVENEYNTKDLIGNLYAIMGNCSYELEDYENAKHYLEQAFEYVEDNPTYYRDYAVSLAKLGDLEKAEDTVEIAVSYGMNQVSMDYVNAEIESSKGNYVAAVSLLEPIIKGKLDIEIYNRALLLAARDYVQMKKYDDALNIYIMIRESGVDTYQIGENIAYLYGQLGDLDSAEQELLSLAEQYPNNYRVYKRLAVLEVQKQDTKANENRDYHQMQEYCNKAFELYEQANVEDSEMEVLKTQLKNVKDGGWL